jgi:hypothetical protein
MRELALGMFCLLFPAGLYQAAYSHGMQLRARVSTSI